MAELVGVERIVGRTSLLLARPDLPAELSRELRSILDDGRDMVAAWLAVSAPAQPAPTMLASSQRQGRRA